MVSRLRRPWTLRARLIASILALMAVVLAIIGVVTTLVLRQQLVNHLDGQLAAANDRAVRFGDRPPPGEGGQHGDIPGFIHAPGQGAGTLAARIVDGLATRPALLDASGETRIIPAPQAAVLADVAADGAAHTVDLGDFGDYRASPNRAPDGSIWVIGLPLSNVDSIIWDLGAVGVLCGRAGSLARRYGRRHHRPVVPAATAPGRRDRHPGG